MQKLFFVAMTTLTLGASAFAADFRTDFHRGGFRPAHYVCSAKNIRGQVFQASSRDLYRAQSKALRACDSRSLSCRLLGCTVVR